MLEEITEPLLGWYEENKRDLQWRRKPEPYHVWVSEIMLQQTRVEAVKEYYRRFLEALPEIADLAACEEERLLKLWEGLGYYNRVKNMQKAARILVAEYGGNMPADYEKILELPGIGSYTAGAVSSIAFGIRKPAVDGNVLRVLSRITEWGEDIGKQSTKKKAEQILQEMMPGDRPGAFNQSLMELGAVVCVPNGAPKCEQCPVGKFCLAREHGTTSQYPKKTSLKKRRIEEKTVLLIQNGQEFAIHRRPDTGLLAGLYELPNVDGFLTEEEVLESVKEMNLMPLYIKKVEDAKHIFSHVEWHMQAYFVRIAATGEKKTGDWTFVDKTESKGTYPIPSAFSAYKKYMEENA